MKMPFEMEVGKLRFVYNHVIMAQKYADSEYILLKLTSKHGNER